MRLGFSAFSAVLFLLAGPASAAVAAYSISAYARVDLVSVYLAGTTLEAWDLLYWEDHSGQVGWYVEDDDDLDWNVADDPYWVVASASITGTANSWRKQGSEAQFVGGAWSEFVNDPEWYCNDAICADGYDLDLTFKYELFAEAQISTTGVGRFDVEDNHASASISISNFRKDFRVEAPPANAAKDSSSGTISMRLEAGHFMSMLADVNLYSDMTVTPVPVPASLPLLGGALLGFGFLRRRSRDRR